MSSWLTGARWLAAPPRLSLCAGGPASAQPSRSDAGHSAMGIERGLPDTALLRPRRRLSSMRAACSIWLSMSGRPGLEVETVADDVGEDLARLSGLQFQIEFDGGLNALVTEKATNKLVFAGAVLEDQSACRMAELLHGDAQSGRLLNPVD